MKIILVFIVFIQLKNFSFGLNEIESNTCKDVFYPKDADFGRSVCEMVISAGFGCEKYEVTTKDDYVLPVFRIVNPLSKTLVKPVLMVHGYLANAAFFIESAPGNGTQFSKDTFNGQPVSENVGYALSMFGYDVWLTGYRGDQDSMKHKTISPKSRKFWEYSTDEHIDYDMPAVIDFIRTKNNSTKMSYIGQSQGTTILFGLLASNPKYNDVIDVGVALAPVGTFAHTKSMLSQLLEIPPWPQVLYLKGGPAGFGYKVNSEFLSNTALNCPLLNAVLPLLYGTFGPSNHLNFSRAHVYFKNFGGGSYWTLARYVQDPHSIRRFDYGPAKNLKKYKSLIPPQYDLAKIRSHICLISGSNDYLATQKDIDFIRKHLNENVLVCDYIYEGLNHMDLGLSAYMTNINLKILQLFAKYK